MTCQNYTMLIAIDLHENIKKPIINMLEQLSPDLMSVT